MEHSEGGRGVEAGAMGGGEVAAEREEGACGWKRGDAGDVT
jgi:hypothetical protein